VLNACVENRTLDNITAVLIGFKGIEKIMEQKRKVCDCLEVQLDWDKLEKEVEDEQRKLGNVFLKPLESVIEEASELETPLSELYVNRKH
jgi:hypothetical protein